MVRRTCILYIYDLFFGCLHNSLFTEICKIGYGDQRQKKKKREVKDLKKKGQRLKKKRSKTENVERRKTKIENMVRD